MFRVQALVAEVAPGLFSAGGIAAANVVTLRDGIQTSGPVVTRDQDGALVPLPIDLGPESQQTVLVLYGTGIRNHLNPVVARIGNEEITASYAGAQRVYAGEDQINVPLPRSLAGAGLVDIVLEVDGQVTNSAKIQIQ